MTNSSKVALVTGANKGIGKEITRQLAAKGFTVLLGARNIDAGTATAKELSTKGARILPLELDVTSQASIDAAAKKIERDFGHLDILVNNAGIALDKPPETIFDFNLLQKTYDTNVFGPFKMIAAMVPLLRKAGHATIVNVSSGLASLTQHSDPKWDFHGINLPAYNSSKSALNALTVHFAALLKGDGIKVNSADPGYVATDINNHQGPRTVEQGATAAVRLALLDKDGPTGGFFDEDGAVPW